MKRKNLLCFLWTLFVLRLNIFVIAEADPAILPGADFGHLQQSHNPLDSRPRLSASQQVQILSDVQQHQQRFHRPGQENSQSNGPYGSLAKYKIDRTKQQQIQQLLQQQQQVQQLLQQQQQKIAQQLGSNGFNGPQAQYYQQVNKQQQQQPQFQSQQYNNQYQNLPNNIQNLQQDLSQPLFSEQHTVQLQSYLEKQRELEELQKQRQQLLLEQQELKRRQELLKLQQLRQLTSTTPSPPPPPLSSSSPSTTAIPFVSTTSAPVLLTSQAARKITTSETELFLKAIASHQKKYSTTTTSIPATVRPLVTIKPTPQENIREESSTIPENLSSFIEEQRRQAIKQGIPRPEIKIIYQTEPPTKQTTAKSKLSESSESLERELLLKQLKSALSETADNDDIRNVTTRDLVLPNGKKLQVIHAPNGLSSIVPTDSSTSLRAATQILSSTTTIKPPKVIFEELTKGVLPPGADFKIIRQKSDGKLEEIGKAPIQNLPAKKVTFVVLEEQPDGSYKVQGVKGNTDKEGTDVESIVEKIKKGELKLPPSSSNPTKTTSEEETNEEIADFVSTKISSPSSRTVNIVPTTSRPTTARFTTPSSRLTSKATSEYYPYVTVSSNSASTGDNYVTSASSLSSHVYNTVGATDINLKSKSHNVQATTRAPIGTKSHFVPTMAPVNEIITTYSPAISTTFSSSSAFSSHFTPRQHSETSPTSRSIVTTTRSSVSTYSKNPIYQDDIERTTISPTESYVNKNQIHESLTTLLRKEGLFAIAKYLRQSGLDTVLNETGPYTIFVPTDKAFRTLLVQLGGPEKAEQKFRDNPRLLSGLLLHHVIPGAFRIDSLQDEMTGVSLAGTQLRVNEYAMHDHEWNDVKQVTTINGAKVAPNKRDIEIPQGIAHAIDRVMFPLPVGDLVQTLQADRERRFTTFLKMLYTSGLDTTLAGPKTFTVFAPTDSAFTAAASKNGTPVWTEEDGPVAAKAIISRHIIPTTLYTAGMRYYLQKDTLRVQSPVHIHKNGGRVRVNEINVVTHNVPATNGVLHAIDGVL
ncbi:ras guanine nucleotide exchange factor R [Polistes fuscatus]|uniref:ras guanine nucleotide exchange factor R n=1 Tax=Polistes fuscatus TaxID=30207 RepID=UPI001CA9BA29|nr:ras guanine nucleotide exchange factor R [Polistes fuscatus]